jgi:transcriptional regulator with XRE-family HTH domain
MTGIPVTGDLKPMQTGAELKAFRERAGVTLTVMAGRIGKDASNLCHIEAGRRKMPSALPELYRKACAAIQAERAQVWVEVVA